MNKVKIGTIYTHNITFYNSRHFYKVVGWLGESSLVYTRVTKSGIRAEGFQLRMSGLDSFSKWFRKATSKELRKEAS